jgi:hypothetical protein
MSQSDVQRNPGAEETLVRHLVERQALDAYAIFPLAGVAPHAVVLARHQVAAHVAAVGDGGDRRLHVPVQRPPLLQGPASRQPEREVLPLVIEPDLHAGSASIIASSQSAVSPVGIGLVTAMVLVLVGPARTQAQGRLRPGPHPLPPPRRPQNRLRRRALCHPSVSTWSIIRQRRERAPLRPSEASSAAVDPPPWLRWRSGVRWMWTTQFSSARLPRECRVASRPTLLVHE